MASRDAVTKLANPASGMDKVHRMPPISVIYQRRHCGVWGAFLPTGERVTGRGRRRWGSFLTVMVKAAC